MGSAFTGFPYAVALRTGSAAAVNVCFVIFFPLFFLTDAVVPKQFLTGWFAAIATYNPVTYLLGGLRSLIVGGWQVRSILEGLAASSGPSAWRASRSHWLRCGPESVWTSEAPPAGVCLASVLRWVRRAVSTGRPAPGDRAAGAGGQGTSALLARGYALP